MMPLYRVAVYLFSFLLKITGVKVKGTENIPPGEIPMVIVSNHTSFADPILVGYAFRSRQVYFVAKKEFSEKKFLGKLFEKLGAIYVDRNEADLLALKKSVSIVKENKALGIFAEGRRNRDGALAEFKQGPIFIAYKGDAVLMPVGIKNAAKLFCFWRRDTVVEIGKPVYIKKEDGKMHDIMDIYTKKLKEAVAELI